MDKTLSGTVDVLAVLDCSIANLLHEDCMPPADPQAVAVMYEKARAAVAELIDKARGLAGAVEFRIDDPRAALLDELRAAITAVGGAK